jgi:hypothetical protein
MGPVLSPGHFNLNKVCPGPISVRGQSGPGGQYAAGIFPIHSLSILSSVAR